MADSYHIIDGQVVPFHGGRKDTNTGAWRDATPMELQLQAELCAAERALEEAAAALEAAREDGWQPIETAPRDGSRILAMIRWSWSDGTDGEAQDVIYWHAGGKFWVCGTPMNYAQGLDDGVEPTHWRPLPAPPAIDQARGKGVQDEA